MDSGDQRALWVEPLFPRHTIWRAHGLLSVTQGKSLARTALARLLASTAHGGHPKGCTMNVDSDALAHFCEALVDQRSDVAETIIQDLHNAGVSADTLYLGYIAGAAALLGEDWDEDRRSFVDVTTATSRLHSLVHAYRDVFHPHEPKGELGMRAFFAALPGETHRLGVMIAAEYFRRAGWTVDHSAPGDLSALQDSVRGHRYDCIGLSAGCRSMIPVLHATVEALRAASPGSLMILGGHLTELEPGVVGEVGADLAVGDVATAPYLVRDVVRERAQAPGLKLGL